MSATTTNTKLSSMERFTMLLDELAVTPDAVACSFKEKDRCLQIAGTLNVADASLVNIACNRFVRETGIAVKRAYKVETAQGGPGKDKLSVEDDELVELHETEASFKAKVQFVADQMKNPAARVVVHTGAGVSTAAKIPDFRGPNGVWTRRDRGMEAPKCIPLEQAVPTYTHRAIKTLLDKGTVEYVVSQNVDGLHRRSGIPEEKLSELHGNCFREICADCKKDHLRYYSVNRHRGPHFRGVQDELSQSGISHITGRKCDACEGMLRDSVIHFTENLPEDHLDRAIKHTKAATMSICLGTSLYVTPAADIPEMCAPGVMVIVCLQRTGKDRAALKSGGVVVHAKCDEFMEAVVKAIGVDVPNSPEDVKRYETDFHQAIEEEARIAKAKEDALEAEKRAADSEKKAAATTAAKSKRKPATNTAISDTFFSEIGLPSSMAQLPDHIAVSETLDRGKPSSWTIAVQCPEGYPIGVADYVEKVWLEVTTNGGGGGGGGGGVGTKTTIAAGEQSPFVVKYQHADSTAAAAAAAAASVVECFVKFHPGLGEVSKQPLRVALKLASESRETDIHKLALPKMRMAPGFLANLTGERPLRSVETRVRRPDGTTYIEPKA